MPACFRLANKSASLDWQLSLSFYFHFQSCDFWLRRIFVPPQGSMMDTLNWHWTLPRTSVITVLCIKIGYVTMFKGQCARFLLSVFHLFDYIDAITVQGFDYNRHGLTAILPNLPCTLSYLYLRHNQITRIEDLSFQCLGYLRALALSNNTLNFISPVAFDPLNSLGYIELRDNPDLIQLPPSFGPNTAYIQVAYINGIGVLDAPTGFMQDMASLNVVGYSFNISNEFFDDCDNLAMVWHWGPSAPNLTDRTPALVRLNVYGVINGYLPDDNVRGLNRLGGVDIGPPCKNIPAFEGATSLTSIRAPLCEVKSVPNLTHLTALQELSFSTALFECDPRCCWMLFEDLSSHTALSWLNTIVCQGADNLRGHNISELSPVQMRCFQSKFHSTNFISPPWYLKTDTQSVALPVVDCIWEISTCSFINYM